MEAGLSGQLHVDRRDRSVDWFYAQHGPSFVSTNTAGKFSLVLFDNGDDRVFSPGVICGDTGEPPCLYSTVQILQLDETAMTATFTFHPTAPTYPSSAEMPKCWPTEMWNSVKRRD